MSEYEFVEKPFLDQLPALGWDVIDQGLGIPQDPAVSGRTSFREVVLTQQFYDSVRSINTTAAGVILGRTTNGRIEWKAKNGKTLKEFQIELAPTEAVEQ